MTQYLNHSGGRIAYDEQGSGQLIICLPGLGDVRAEYRLLAPELVAAGYRVVTCDLRGLGASSVGWERYNVAAIGDDIVALVEELGSPATIIGTSMAAGAAVVAAAQRPELISGLVLVGPFVRDTMPVWVARLFLPLFSGPWAVAVWRWYYTRLYPTQKPADFPQYLAALAANLREPGRMAALRGMFSASKATAEAALAGVTAPALVVMGSRDPDFKQPAAEARWIAERLQGSVALIEGAGHYPHAEMPDQVLPELLEFLGRLETAHGA